MSEQTLQEIIAEARKANPGVVPGAALMRAFSSGATRNVDQSKPDYEGFLSPLVIEEFGRYMHRNRVQADGSVRDSDNWQKGIPLESYMKSGWRHFHEWWKTHRGFSSEQSRLDALMALLFNVQGYAHELLKQKGEAK